MRNKFLWLFLLATIVYIIGFDITIMDVDSAQYASISREMSETNEYLQVKHRGEDYLDKPPLLFWITSFVFEIFGFHNWSFKIGSFLFTLLGVFSTFRLGKLLYSKEVGIKAALILYSCQAFFLFNNDVRTDTILTGAVIFAIWQWMEWLHNPKWKWILGLSFGVALAMLSKGPIGLMVPVIAVGSYILGKGAWGKIFRWEYIVMLALVGVFISPMVYGLYQQFDLHPEKVTQMVSPDGLKPVKGVSGIEFYFWTQSFGRISGENVWKDSSGPFFFVHNFLWSFLPWSLIFIPAFFKRFRDIVISWFNKGEKPKWLSAFGFLIPFLVLSTSSYKLPHYIFPLYPLAAILIASWWEEIKTFKSKNAWINSALAIQWLVFMASTSIITLIYFWFFLNPPILLLVVTYGLLALSFYTLITPERKDSLLVSVVILACSINFMMNSWFYPQLTSLQAGNQIVDSLNNNNIKGENTYLYSYYSFSYHYYQKAELNLVSEGKLFSRLENNRNTVLIFPENNLDHLNSKFEMEPIDSIKHHPVTRLSIPFLMAKTRQENLQTLYISKIVDYK